MSVPTGYSVIGYGDMITCEPRMSAYAEALRQAITPGCTVIDIGAGSGIFSLLACRYGAGSVIAIETHDAVELLHAAAVANGVRDRITVVQGLSTEFAATVKADVIISDLRGCLPLFEGHIPTIVDARERLLAPGGRLIPMRDRLRVALANHPKTHNSYEEPWLHNKFGLDLSTAHRFAVNQWRKVNFAPADLISNAQDLLVLDYSVISDPNIKVETELTAERAGTAHGFVVWFDAELGPGIGFSNAPGEPEQVYSQSFFPFERAVELTRGDRIEIKLKANLIDGSYVWSWNSCVWRSSSKLPETTYRQSTFLSKILSPRKLAMRSSRFVPPARHAHAVDRHCLSLFDGVKTLGEIAHEVSTEFPDAFTNSVDALRHVTELAERYHKGAVQFEKPNSAIAPVEDDFQ